MVFAFSAGQEISDVVVTQSFAEAERSGLRAIGFGGLRRKDGVQSNSQRHVHDFFERFL